MSEPCVDRHAPGTPRCRVDTLHRSAVVTVCDVDCSERASRPGAEERASGHTLIFVRRGVFVKHEGAARAPALVAEPVHALFMNADAPYRVSHPTDDGDACTTLTFPEATLVDALAAEDPWVEDRRAAPFALPRAPVGAHVALRMRALRRALRGAGATTLAVDEEALTLLGDVTDAARRAHGLASSARRTETLHDRRALVEHTKSVLAARPGDHRSLASLAREVASSPFHLTRVFRETVGVPVHQYLLRLRLATALERLDGGDAAIGPLAHELGFSSHGHFSAAFRARYGVTPSAYAR